MVLMLMNANLLMLILLLAKTNEMITKINI